MMLDKVLLAVFLACFVSRGLTAGPGSCGDVLDVVTVIDGSDSIASDDFLLVKQAIGDLVNQLTLGFLKTRFGVVLYSTSVSNTIPMSWNPFDIQNKINLLVQPRDGTNTHLAIAQMNQLLNSDFNRNSVPKIGLIITDGISKQPVLTKAEADKIKAQGVTLYVIAVGDEVKLRELEEIASSKADIKYALNFKNLGQTIRDLLPKTCPSTTPPTTPTIPTTTPRPTPTQFDPRAVTLSTPDPSVCDGCKRDNGIGYLPYPTDCQKYIQCDFSDAALTKVWVKDCNHGLYWDQDILTCNAMDKVNCVNDPCKTPGVTHYPSRHNCRQYYKCGEPFAAPLCCSSGFTYKNNICSADSSCITGCGANAGPAAPVFRTCDKLMVPGKPDHYKENVPGFGPMDRPCAPGTLFNSSTCNCTNLGNTQVSSTANPAPASGDCKQILKIDFDNDVSDAMGAWVQNNGVSVESGEGYFNGNANLRVPRFSNTEFGSKLTIKIKYRTEGFVNSQQALITNRDCTKPGSIGIFVNPTQTTFLVKSGNVETRVQVPASNQGGAPRIVEYVVENGILKGTVNGASQQQAMSGDVINKSECGLQIGHGISYAKFKGFIDYIYVFKC